MEIKKIIIWGKSGHPLPILTIWGRAFNSTCIFNHCTDKSDLKMYVDGEENMKFEDYIMRDGDHIRIEYTMLGG